ncbi:acyl-CoA dehydrogenase NM domain-like protein [Lophium mytilinum]|uniref:Acyl-CoA dehydrogenase NM domain-like protein n=1 Tax=Lophium mytilinum TaxID=390894 RepID=A0A6A6QX42_9PEZI|nr:acyl-CoA dehydrogenase NM domain-like protein [Lophium mytilinum]
MTNTSEVPLNGASATHGREFESTDPAVYSEYSKKWTELPKDEDGWVARAKEVSEILAKDVVKRNAENKAPFAEVALLKHAGLLKVLGPKKYGGGEQPWSLAYRLIREVSNGDSSLGMLLGYHLLWSTTANVVGTPEQADRTQELILSNNYFIGGAVNPRDEDHKIANDGDHFVFNGFKRFNTGGVVSDLTVLEGVLEGTEHHIFAFVKTQQSGIEFQHDWHNIGLRLSESGSVKITNIRVPWVDALGWSPEKKEPIPDILTIPFATLLLPAIQLVFSNLYLGIAQGALTAAAAYTLKSTRPWPYAGNDRKTTATDEFYILERYGNFYAHVAAASALADRAGALVSSIYSTHTSDRKSLTAARRGELAEEVASVKVVTTDTGLRVTAGVFEVTGASATGERLGLDRFWRDLRTHTLHDPVAYKNRELGRWRLLGEAPEPSWYS